MIDTILGNIDGCTLGLDVGKIWALKIDRLMVVMVTRPKDLFLETHCYLLMVKWLSLIVSTNWYLLMVKCFELGLGVVIELGSLVGSSQDHNDEKYEGLFIGD